MSSFVAPVCNVIKTDLLSCSKGVFPAIHGSTELIFRWLKPLHEGLVFMILCGEKLLLQDYNFKLKDPSQITTCMSMLLLFLQLMNDTSLLAHRTLVINLQYPCLLPISQVQEWCVQWFIKYFHPFADWTSPRNSFPVDCISVAEHLSRCYFFKTWLFITTHSYLQHCLEYPSFI